MTASPPPRTVGEVCDAISARNGYRLRPWEQKWGDVLCAAWLDPEISKWNPVPPEPSIALAESWISGAASQNEASIGIDLVMVDDETDAPAGEIGLQVDPVQGVAEVGFWLAESFRGQGVSKSLLAFAQDLASQLELVGIVALVHADNSAAIAACESMAWPEVPTKSERRAFAYRTP